MRISFVIVLLLLTLSTQAQKKFSVIAYYAGGPEKVDSLAAEKLTHIIFSSR